MINEGKRNVLTLVVDDFDHKGAFYAFLPLPGTDAGVARVHDRGS